MWRHLIEVKVKFYEALADMSTATEQLSEIGDTCTNRNAALWTGGLYFCNSMANPIFVGCAPLPI